MLSPLPQAPAAPLTHHEPLEPPPPAQDGQTPNHGPSELPVTSSKVFSKQSLW